MAIVDGEINTLENCVTCYSILPSLYVISGPFPGINWGDLHSCSYVTVHCPPPALRFLCHGLTGSSFRLVNLESNNFYLNPQNVLI